MDETENCGQSFFPTASHRNLIARSQLLQDLRNFFTSRSFIEVETPVISADTVVDRYLEPIAVRLDETDRWLQTSPEFAMKRLVASGMTAIFQITRAFRNEEFGPLHNPEFTMLEWYRVGESYAHGMDFLDELCTSILGHTTVDRMTYRDAFRRFANIDPLDAKVEELSSVVEGRDVQIPVTMKKADRDEWLNLILAEIVEQRLREFGAVILFDYPITQAALAKTSDVDPRVAERFELYVDGIELANGYHELVDSSELKRRNQRTNEKRSEDGKCLLPVNSRMLQAIEYGLPACTGVALGVDRLLMKRVGAKEISEVIAFPFDIA